MEAATVLAVVLACTVGRASPPSPGPWESFKRDDPYDAQARLREVGDTEKEAPGPSGALTAVPPALGCRTTGSPAEPT